MGSSKKKKRKPPVASKPETESASAVDSADQSVTPSMSQAVPQSDSESGSQNSSAGRAGSKLPLQLTIFLFAIWLCALAFLAYRVNFGG